MTTKNLLGEMHLIRAINDLSSMADLSQDMLARVEAESADYVTFMYPWLDLSSEDKTLSNIQHTFKVILEYFKHLHAFDHDKLLDHEMQKGLRSLIALSQEALVKIDQNLTFSQHGSLLKNEAYLKEYQELIDFYQKKIQKGFEKELPEESHWKEDWKEVQKTDVEAEDFKGVRALSDIKEDSHYELFLIKQENGRQYFSKRLLKSLHLVQDFDPIIFSEIKDHIFHDIDKVQNHDAQLSAHDIKTSLMGKLQYFFKRRDHFSSSELYSYLSYSLYALFLASAPHRASITSHKQSLRYFSDFAKFLQLAITSNDFAHYAQVNLQAIDSYIQELMHVVYRLCMHLFLRVEAKDQMIGFIYRLLDKPTLSRKKVEQRHPLHLWETLKGEYQLLSKIMQRYPSGPLYKTVEYLKHPDEECYDFITMENFPSVLFDIQMGSIKTKVMRLPSPTRQTMIQKAQDISLFKMLLRALAAENPHNQFLLINLQDRTSWQEYARCECLENLPSDSGDYKQLTVCTIARDTSFYSQSEEYEEIHEAAEFKKAFKDQFAQEKACGYYFPKLINTKDFHHDILEMIEVIHEHIFNGNKTLTKKNRLDFIEIVHYLLVLKIQEKVQPTHMSMTCKDAIDTGPSFYTGYFAFTKLLSQDPLLSVEDEDFMVYMIHSPALLQRDRLINRERFERCISALTVFSAELDAKRSKILKAIGELFSKDFFKYLSSWEFKQ